MPEPKKLPPHPGVILKTEFLDRYGLTGIALARAIGEPEPHVTGVVRGNRDITALLAVKLALYYGGTAEFWMELQTTHDLAEANAKVPQTMINRIVLNSPHRVKKEPVGES